MVEGVPLEGEASRDWNRNKSLAVCGLLVEAGAAEEDGVMVLDAAIKEGNGDLVRRLLRRDLNPRSFIAIIWRSSRPLQRTMKIAWTLVYCRNTPSARTMSRSSSISSQSTDGRWVISAA